MSSVVNIYDDHSQLPASFRAVLEKILDWSEKRSMWQRDALRLILQKNNIEDQDVQELVSYLKLEKAGKLEEITASPLSEDDLPANPESTEAVNILKLSNISHVNNLAVDQELVFSDKGITVIYGGNGSGKSGYTRILKSACRARHRDRILTNIFAPEYKDETPTADITYSTASKPEKTISWEDSDRPHGLLSAVSVFDRECATIHIQKKGNKIAFRPYGLDIPDTLAEVCKRVEASIKDEIQDLESSQNAIFQNPPWYQITLAGKFVSEITKDTKPEDVDKVCDFTEEDEERLKFLTETLSKDIQKAAREENLKAERLLRFKGDINAKMQKLTQDKLDALLTQRAMAEEARQAAELAASKMLDGDVLPDIGGQVWKRMWLAAKQYSVEAAYPDQPFPNTEDGAKCVLCQQPLEGDAKERMQAFEKHVSGDLEKQARQEKEAFDQLYRQSVFAYICFSDYQDIMEDIGLNNPSLLKQVRRFLASIRLRQITFKRVADKITGVSLSEYAMSPFEAIDKQVEKYKNAAQELQKSANDEGIAKIKAEKLGLQDKKTVKEQKNAILDEIKRLQDIAFLQKCAKDTATRKITTLGNDIADDVITPKIRDRFQEEIVDLVGKRVRVEIVRSGGSYGSPNYKLSLLSSPGTDLSTVLSEGEQTCVAIAAFLAELATSSHKSALVFDDPVSSLDHDWRHKVADRLVEEAKSRQVIVFTHDLVFLNDIEDSANGKGVDFLSRHLMRTPKKVGLVNDNLPWDGMKTKARIDALEKEARKLRDTRDDLTQEDYNNKAGSFYSRMRASWERALEEVGLCRVVVRHRDYIDPKDIAKISAIDLSSCEKWYECYKRCCDYVEGHDTSRARNQALPEPDKLLEECAELSAWVKSLRDSQKLIANN